MREKGREFNYQHVLTVSFHPSCCSCSEPHLFPAVEVHAGQLAVVRLGYVDVQGLALVDEGAAVSGHLEYGFLGDLPHGFIQLLQILWDLVDVLSE